MDEWIHLFWKAQEYRGAGFGLPLLALFMFFIVLWPKGARLIQLRYERIAVALIVLFTAIGVTYLIYPNYIDHAEATMAGLGRVMARGGELYPYPNLFPYHGILYGPALAEIQFIVSLLGLPTLMSSKLPGLLSFILLSLILLRLNKVPASRGYLLYLFPFGVMLFWDRTEPFILLLVCLALLLDGKHNKKYIPILMGILAGTASALKLHAAVYVFTAYLAVFLVSGISIASLVIFSLVSMLTFATYFLPPNISFIAFIEYIKFASNHGLSFNLWIQNFTYFIFLTIPLLILWRGAAQTRKTTRNLILVVGIEFVVTIIAAKPGAGAHHLLPFIPVNAFLIQKMYVDDMTASLTPIRVLYASLIMSISLTVSGLIWTVSASWNLYQGPRKEVAWFQEKYDGLVMGVGDDRSFFYSFLRVDLADEQIDYSGYMDLQYAGAGEKEFIAKMSNCNIRNLLIPNFGLPFSMNSYYTGKSLFTEDVLNAFRANYRKNESGKYFSVYSCERGL